MGFLVLILGTKQNSSLKVLPKNLNIFYFPFLLHLIILGTF